MKYDLITVGGGFSGVAASVAAARMGLRVLLIEKSGYLGGAACNCYVNPFMPYHVKIDGKQRMISDGIFSEILDRLEALNGLDRKTKTFSEEILKLVFDALTEENGIDVVFHSYLTGVEKEGEKLLKIKTAGKSGEQSFEADYFIDATGDGDLSVLAGCPYVLGREPDHLCQPMTLCFRISGVDTEAVWGMGAQIDEKYKQFREEGKIKNPREDVLKFRHVADGVVHFNSTRIVKKCPVDVFDLSYAEREARKQMYELYTFLKENFEPFKNSVLLASAPEIGVRESRMIQGEYVLNVEDLKNCTKFEDAIAASNYDIDIHNPEGSGTSHYYFEDGQYYTIPYRCLQPKGAENLLTAGRCISSTHEAQASYRIMPVCCSLGQAAGTAAALACKQKIGVKMVDVKQLQKILKENGAFF